MSAVFGIVPPPTGTTLDFSSASSGSLADSPDLRWVRRFRPDHHAPQCPAEWRLVLLRCDSEARRRIRDLSAVPVSITTISLPGATQEASYSTQLAAADGTPPYSWSATGLPGGLSVSTGGIIVPFQDCVLIQEDVQRSRNPNAAFRLWDSKTLFQKVRVGGVHLEAVDSLAAFTPPLLGHLPAEIEHPHSFATIAPNTVFVLCPFGAEVLV